MAIVTVNDEYLTDIADSIRSKLGVQTTYKPSQMADAIEAISGGGITPTGTKQISITQNGTTTEDVTNYASAEINANVPNSYSAGDEGKVVSNGALVSQTAHADVTPTTSDQTIDTTENNSIKVKGDANLIAGNIKKDVTIFSVTGSYEGGGASYDFADMSKPEGEITTEVTTLPSSVFQSRTGITKVNAPNATALGNYTFDRMSNLEELYLPNLVSFANNYAFAECPKLKGLVLPKTGTAQSVFAGHSCYGDTLLEYVDCNGSSSNNVINATDAFVNCSNLTVFIIRRTDRVCPISSVNSFNGTPFASGGTGGTLYVPSALKSQYEASTNWATLLGYTNNQIKAIEGSIYETKYADGTSIPT